MLVLMLMLQQFLLALSEVLGEGDVVLGQDASGYSGDEHAAHE